MAHMVKCKYCGKSFDRDKVPFIQVSERRYAHPECHKEHEENKTQEEIDKENLEKYIMELFHEPYVNARIQKQIKTFKEDYPNFTYSGMHKTLIYWYEIKCNSIEKANGGIGIIPFVYKDASMYFYSLYMAQLANKDKEISEPNVKVISIESPQAAIKKPKFFDLGDDDE